ncbi:hypothetical protein FHS29_006468 [Saccharothrix tamanrassetensis]|uniref:Uncharacterized protein n=1 Tax=Saccharothrix tamanrassetensis TaxID=1051531 RepID=A0A841CWV8_9PSEU|nr:hypothetical protein [Saccharothrix tamanrassetensis]MBB5959846.1 hypothetical protein [Saccharothrix tamanrassetensis]
MRNPELHVELPPDLPGDRYEGIRHAVSSLLELWGVPDGSAQLVSRAPDPAGATGNGTAE